MTYPFSQDTLVKDIVNEMPKAADVFKKRRIDYCCGGGIPLAQAASERSVDIQELTDELTRIYEAGASGKEDVEVWTDSESDVIINHIQQRYHQPLLEELKNLSPYVTKVARVHGGRHPELLRVFELFYEFKKEMIEHTAKEDEQVFPLLLQLENPNVPNREEMIEQIRELEKEHDHTGAILKDIREVTNDFELPIDACNTYRLVYKRLEELESETFNHVHLENNILFPRYLG